MGGEGPAILAADGEGPVREAEIASFRIAPTTVDNADFAAFVQDTGYATEAERLGWSFVFANHLSPALAAESDAPRGLPWWRAVAGACWHAPEGPGSTLAGRADHPVVHVTWSDAEQYCAWAGLRLPTEEEWEFAARGGLEQAPYPWGRELVPGGRHRCNIWQGRFPAEDAAEDGYAGTAPVRSFPPNGFGLYQMIGNVWEWCHRPALDRPAPEYLRPVRGGSFLCHASYCSRYRVSSRLVVAWGTSTSHIGFRTAGHS